MSISANSIRIGQNPTSGVLSVPRRKDIYALCQKYDIIIVEDEPYWYLQFPSGSFQPPPPPKKSSGFKFLDSLVPSYLSIDTDGRVVRLDTFSKTVAPGCRLGWITAQPAIVERLLRITETSTQQPSGFVQSMVAEMLVGPSKGGQGSGGSKNGTGWDMTGWVRWLEGLRGEYERRMNMMCDGLEAAKEGKLKIGHHKDSESDWVVVKKTSIVDFTRPAGGMFIWLRVNFENHPLFDKIAAQRLAMGMWVYWTTAPHKVLVAPGGMFCPTPEIMQSEGWKFFRLCFAALPLEDLEDVTKRLVGGLSGFWEIKDSKVIDELLKDFDNVDGAMETDMTDMSMPHFC
jgi:DNA-binding transcriptional MocR family regulator